MHISFLLFSGFLLLLSSLSLKSSVYILNSQSHELGRARERKGGILSSPAISSYPWGPWGPEEVKSHAQDHSKWVSRPASSWARWRLFHVILVWFLPIRVGITVVLPIVFLLMLLNTKIKSNFTMRNNVLIIYPS